jgi:hypothetical protein
MIARTIQNPHTIHRTLAHRATYQYCALQHPNVFGDAPRMLRGVITRDLRNDELDGGTKRRGPKLFRPVVGTFFAYGDSEDTHDLSYAARQQPPQL